MDQELVVKQVEAIIEPQEEAPDLEVKKIIGQEPERSYYLDSNGNIYWVISQTAGLVEKV